METGKNFSIKYSILPKNTTDKKVVWKSNNPSCVKVDKKGNIKALTRGEAIITATTSNGKKVQKKIKVYEPIDLNPSILVSQGIDAITVTEEHYTISGTVEDFNDKYYDLKVYINDEVISLDYFYNFFKMIKLTAGKNIITIKAVNTYGRETIVTKEVTFAPLWSTLY